MARPPRIHYPGALYHVMLRGNGGADIFFDRNDRYHLYLLLQAGIAKYGHRLHAFCAMSNHLHLAVQVAEVPLSKIMQNVAFRYTRWINRKQGKMGHLFQGRYKAILVDQDAYLLALTRYIHLNPVRAGLVKDPSAYPWSGHRAYVGRESLPWLTTDWVLSQFASHAGHARRVIKRLLCKVGMKAIAKTSTRARKQGGSWVMIRLSNKPSSALVSVSGVRSTWIVSSRASAERTN